jgi:formylglycine-generating enzyme required for sulfatase activity
MANETKIGDVKSERDTIIGNQYVTNIIQVARFTAPVNLEKSRADYLDNLRRLYRALDFKGIPQLESLAHELLLEDVYVPLVARPELPSGGETWERRLAGRAMDQDHIPGDALALLEKGDARPVKVEQALRKKARIVVLGDPGSGKSTLLKYLALRLAAEAGALPILLPLNAYAAVLEKEDINLQEYLARYFAGLAHGLSNLQPLFDSAITQGQAVILLDGLDEVQSERVRPALVSRVEAFAVEAVAQNCKLIVTSRIVGYRESPLTSKDWTLYTLLDFDRQAIESFAEKWCLAFERSTRGNAPDVKSAAEAERRSLLDSLDASPGVADLASNPLLLTILALIKRQGVSLPNRRIELYELYLKTLISAWSKARALDKRPVGPNLDYLQYVKILGPLALWLREKNPTAGLVPEEALLDWLTDHYIKIWGVASGPASEKAREFLENIRHYSNLLLERGKGRYGFIHLTFEEALAARGLVQVGQLDLKFSLAYIQKYINDPGWRETILLSIGVWGIVREESEKAGEVLRAMLKMDCDKDVCRNVLMAGACLADVGELGLGRIAAEETIEALTVASVNRSLPAEVQRDAGFLLGRLAGGSPEFLTRIRPDLDDWVPIPAGPFLYGEKKQKAVIKVPFCITKYPVTNLQFRRFIEADGYNNKEFWSTDGWLWRTGKWDTKAPSYMKDILKERPAKQRNEPFYWHDQRWNNPLTPVVGVSWFEAEAYANWLVKQLEHSIRLPSEQEWERAARWTDGREFPWGNAEANNLNCHEFWNQRKNQQVFSSTTMVGQFSEGNAPEGTSDASGNVWEWMDSWYEKEQTSRVLRGGSWYDDPGVCRCAFRLGYVPDNVSNLVGFRLVSPGSDISGS